MSARYDLHCVDFVACVSPYLNRRIDPELRGRLEEHLAACSGCSAYLDQFRETLRLLARLRAVPPAPQRRRQLERLLLDEAPPE